MVYAQPLRLRKPAQQHGVQTLDGGLLRDALHIGGRAKAVRHAAPAQGNAPLARALGVAIGVSRVADQFAAAPANRIPQRIR